MSDVYSPLNEDFMFQEMEDRVARFNPKRERRNLDDSGPTRRWWRRGPRVAR